MSAERLDAALVSRGLVRSRAQAKDVLAQGAVTVAGQVETKASVKVAAEQEIALIGAVDHYVGRAAHKLLAAIEAFSPFADALPGCAAIDVGAPTYRCVRRWLEHHPPVPLAQVDPLIRQLAAYRDVVTRLSSMTTTTTTTTTDQTETA